MDQITQSSRRRALLAAGALCAAATLFASRRSAAAKADKSLLQYQDSPRNGKACIDCWAWVPGRGGNAGTCKAVEGPVSARGWCQAYAPRRTGKR